MMDKINNLIYYAVVLFLLAVSYVFYHSYFLLVLMAVLGTAFVASMLSFAIAYKRVKFKLSMEEVRVCKNEEVTVWVNIKNASILPMISVDTHIEVHNGFLKDKESYTINCSVPALATKKVGVVIEPKYCGIVNVEIKKTTMRCVFNLVGYTKEQNESLEFEVMPLDLAVAGAEGKNSFGEADFEIDKKALEGYDVIDIKNYKPGDKLQKIHWKLSGKSDELLVKEMADTLDSKIVLICELYGGSPEVLDRLIDAIYSISLMLIKRGESFFVCYRGSGVEQMSRFEIGSERDLEKLIREIYFAFPSDVIDNAYQGYRRQFSTLGGVIYIAPSERENQIAGEVIARCGNEVVVMAI